MTTLRNYCQKSCGLCGTGGAGLSCNNLVQKCSSGVCVAQTYFTVASIKCVCPTNSAGTYCERSTICTLWFSIIKNVIIVVNSYEGNPCANTPCANGGTCTPLNDADLLYSCACPSGCSGDRCQTCVNPSLCSITCQNGGQCSINSFGVQYCICQNGYSGQSCQTCRKFIFIKRINLRLLIIQKL